jgi:hypothetical protein
MDLRLLISCKRSEGPTSAFDTPAKDLVPLPKFRTSVTNYLQRKANLSLVVAVAE